MSGLLGGLFGNQCGDGCDNNWIWIIIIIILCSSGNTGFGGFFDNKDKCGSGNNSEWIIWILLIFCLCGNNGFLNSGCGCLDT